MDSTNPHDMKKLGSPKYRAAVPNITLLTFNIKLNFQQFVSSFHTYEVFCAIMYCTLHHQIS